MRINGIDDKDNEIVNLLLQDSRMSYSEIGERIGMTHTSVRKRIANLEKNGIKQEERKSEVKETRNAYGITRGAAYYSSRRKDGDCK